MNKKRHKNKKRTFASSLMSNSEKKSGISPYSSKIWNSRVVSRRKRELAKQK